MLEGENFQCRTSGGFHTITQYDLRGIPITGFCDNSLELRKNMIVLRPTRSQCCLMLEHRQPLHAEAPHMTFPRHWYTFQSLQNLAPQNCYHFLPILTVAAVVVFLVLAWLWNNFQCKELWWNQLEIQQSRRPGKNQRHRWMWECFRSENVFNWQRQPGDSLNIDSINIPKPPPPWIVLAIDKSCFLYYWVCKHRKDC